MKFLGSRLLVAIVASAITALPFTITFASASTRNANYPGSVYSQTCKYIGAVPVGNGNGPCRQLHNPLGHVEEAHNNYLECRYP